MNQAKEKRLQFTEKAQQIVDRMTLEEKVYLMSGNLSLQDMMADAMGCVRNRGKHLFSGNNVPRRQL